MAYILSAHQLTEDTFNRIQPQNLLQHQKFSLHRTTCAIMPALYLEALINFFGAWNNVKFRNDNLEMLSTRRKFQVYPLMVGTKEMPGQSFSYIKKLTDMRDKCVHRKSTVTKVGYNTNQSKLDDWMLLRQCSQPYITHTLNRITEELSALSPKT